MLHEVQWTADELAELRRMVTHEWMETRDELHHTANIEYRDKVKAHLALLAGMMRQLETAPTRAILG